MTTENTTDSGFGRREQTAAERELEELLAAARALGLESEEQAEAPDFDAAAAGALVELGLDRPVEAEPTPIASFLVEEEEAAQPLPTQEEIEQEGVAWFAVNTYTGHETRVQKALDKRIVNMDAEAHFVELTAEQAGPHKGRGRPPKRFVLVPTLQEVEIRGGKRKAVERKILPGYVLLQIRLDEASGEISDDSWYVVKGTAGVTGFVGTRDEVREQARPLPWGEVAKIIGQTQVDEPQIRVGFEVGDTVQVTDGVFADHMAEVVEINLQKGKVRVRITFLGTDAPMELDFDQVEKI